MQREKSIKIIIVVLFSIIIFCYIGVNLSEFIEQGGITKSIITNKEKYALPDYKGIDYQRLKSYCYNIIKPDIITIGSSRVLQFRENFFAKKFYNLGSTIGNLEDISILIPYLDKHHKPDLLIFGIDWWWFNNEYPIYTGIKNKNSFFRPIKYLLKGYFSLFNKSISINDFFKSLKISTLAQENCTLNDGSYIYFDITHKGNQDKNFQKTIQRIEDNTFPFFTARKISQRHIASFVEAAKEINKLANTVIFILPPVSNVIFSELKKYSLFFPHLFLLKTALEQNGIKVYDFTNPQTIRSSDCEMIDGFHGGDITYAKILLQLAKDIPQIGYFINKIYLEQNIIEYADHAMIPNKYFAKPEVDFLELNCKKQIIYHK